MNIRKAKKLIGQAVDINSLPLKVMRAGSISIQRLLASKETRFGIVEYDRFGPDRYYELSSEDRATMGESLILYTRKWERDGEPELEFFEHGYWDKELGLADDRDYFHTGGGRTVLIHGKVFRRNMTEKEYMWLCKNSEKYEEVRPGISILK